MSASSYSARQSLELQREVSETVEHSVIGKEDNTQVPSSVEDVIFLRLPDVKAVTGLSKTSLYVLIREKSFPAPVRLGQRTVAWVHSEVRQWAAERVRASRSAISSQGATLRRPAHRKSGLQRRSA